MISTEISSPLPRARITTRGAALTGLWRKGWAPSVVLGTKDPAQLLNAHPYAGTVIGPIASRIGGARLRIEGKTYTLPANEGPNSLHSGPEGLHAREWTIIAQSTASVTLHTALPDGACGLPGTRQFTAQYVVQDDTLWLSLTAHSDATTAMALAHHPYWTMNGTGLEGHRLWLAAERYLTVTDALLPIGDSAPLRDLGLTPHHPSALKAPLDHAICLAPAPRQVPIFAARLDANKGPRLHLRTTAPGLQIYDGGGLPQLPGTGIHPYAGLALEPQMWPDSPNHRNFPAILLPKDVAFRQKTADHLELF